jgi:hypothetical protein
VITRRRVDPPRFYDVYAYKCSKSSNSRLWCTPAGEGLDVRVSGADKVAAVQLAGAAGADTAFSSSAAQPIRPSLKKTASYKIYSAKLPGLKLRMVDHARARRAVAAAAQGLRHQGRLPVVDRPKADLDLAGGQAGLRLGFFLCGGWFEGEELRGGGKEGPSQTA